MARISTYPVISVPTINDLLIGTDVENLNETKNFSVGDISQLISQGFVPYTGATQDLDLGSHSATGDAFIVNGGTSGQFLKADGSLDSTVYTPQSRTLTINGVTQNLSANRTWTIPLIDTLTTTGTGGPATLVGSVLNIPQYQAQGNYITSLTGQATASGPGAANVTLSNSAVIAKVLTGLNVTGGTIVATDSILQAFGKVQNQINGLVGGVSYQGTWNANTNSPTLTSSVGTKGYYYIVSVAGSTNLNGVTSWNVGDWAIFNGTTWAKVDNTDSVTSVNGYTGAVNLTYTDVGAVPTSRTLTINGTSYSLAANRTWTVGDVMTSGSYANPSWITSLAWSKITNTPTTLAGYGILDAVPYSTTITINGVTQDLSTNRTWTVGGVSSVGTSGPLTGGPITTSGTIGITKADTTTDGYLSSTDWNTFNGKQSTISASSPITFSANTVGITQSGASTDGYLSSTDWNTFNSKQNALTNPVTGTGTAYTIPMWSGTTTLTNSILSYGSDTLTATYNSTTGATVVFNNTGLTAYAYTIQMNNFGVTRLTTHSYTDGNVSYSIGGTQTMRMFGDNTVAIGTATTSSGYKFDVDGTVRMQSDVVMSGIANTSASYVLFYDSTTNQVTYGTAPSTGISSLNGLTAATQLFATDTTGTDFTITSSVDTHTFSIPDASTTARGLVTIGTQTFGGSKTFDNYLTLNQGLSIANNVFFSNAIPTPSAMYWGPLVNPLGGNNTYYIQETYTYGQTLTAGSSICTVSIESYNDYTTASVNPYSHYNAFQLGIQPLSINNGGMPIVNAATLFIQGAATGTATITNNYAFWVGGGATRLEGALELRGIANTSQSNVLYYNATTKQVTYSTAPTGGGGASSALFNYYNFI